MTEIVKELATIKERQARETMEDAREEIRTTKRLLKPLVTQEKYIHTLLRVSEAKKHDTKLKFLLAKHGDCCKLHKEQREWEQKKTGSCSRLKSSSNPTSTTPTTPTPPPPLPPVTKKMGMDPLIVNTLITDDDLNNKFGVHNTDSDLDNIPTFGDVDLDHEERLILSKRPEFAIYNKVDKKSLQEEMSITLTKIRWERRTRDWTPGDEDVTPAEAGERDKVDLQQQLEDCQSRLIFNQENLTVDLGACRATDMKLNQRLILPQPCPAAKEAVLGARHIVWQAAADNWTKDNCSPDGTQLSHNLTADERIGLSKVQKRVKQGEITVVKSDKGNQLTVSSLDSYSAQGDSHTSLDRRISHLETEQNQARMNTLCRSLANIFGLGKNGGEKNAARCWGNLLTEASNAPTLYPCPKTHKPVGDDGNPKSRTIVQASSCLTTRPSEIVADILESALMAFPTQHECKITEDMLAMVDQANLKVQEVGVDVCVGSGDMVALYPG